jgi:hypothetical protein
MSHADHLMLIGCFITLVCINVQLMYVNKRLDRNSNK